MMAVVVVPVWVWFVQAPAGAVEASRYWRVVAGDVGVFGYVVGSS